MANKCAKAVQNDFAKGLAFGTIVWDLFTKDQKHEVEEKLKTTYPDPYPGNINSEDSTLLKEIEKQKKKVNECRKAVLEALWNQRKYNNKNLLMSPIFVLVTEPAKSDDAALNATEFSCFPLFRIRKCRVREDTTDCCMLYVDDAARVYQNWNDYLENNVLPEGKMVVPEGGFYHLDGSGNVLLTVHETAALRDTNLRKIDVGAGYVGMAAAGVTVGAAFLPVVAPVVGVAAVAGLASAGWSTVRSAFQLKNRDSHEQSNSFADRDARGHWLGFAGGVVGLGAMGATFGMVRHVAAGGNVSMIARAAVDGLNASALIINGVCVGNGSIELYLKAEDGEPITTLDLVQLGASLFLFTHSVSNFQTASNIVNSTRNGTISQFREGLSNRQRKMFDKMAKETVRVRGSDHGKMDIIRGLKNIPDNKYFNDVYKVNKQLNENNVRPSFSSDGNVLLNNEVSVDSASLRSNLQHGIGEPIINRAGGIPSTHTDGSPGNFFGNINVNSANRILLTVLDSANACRITNQIDIQNLILNILSNFSQETLQTLIDIANRFMQEYLPAIEDLVNRYIDYEEVLQRTLAISLKLTAGNPLLMTESYLRMRTGNILRTLQDLFLESNPSSSEGLQKCEVCQGYYSITL